LCCFGWSERFVNQEASVIIDAHAHTNGGNLGNFKAGLLASRGYHGGHYQENEEALKRAIDNHKTNILDSVGTDIQFLSPPVSTDALGEAGENRELVRARIE
jgi:hypothetical protein